MKGLDALVAEGHITKRDRLILEAAVEAGNAAAHRGFQPERADLLQVISIVEHLLEREYVLTPGAKALRARTPRRRRR